MTTVLPCIVLCDSMLSFSSELYQHKVLLLTLFEILLYVLSICSRADTIADAVEFFLPNNRFLKPMVFPPASIYYFYFDLSGYGL